MNHMKFVIFHLICFFSALGWLSNSWLVILFLMEVSLVMFMGLVSFVSNYGIAEFMMKYFIVQVFFSLIFFMVLVFYSFFICLGVGDAVILFLFLKLGLFPFHFWLIMVLGKLNWLVVFVLSTIMKLVPIVLIYYTIDLLILSLGLCGSVLFGSILGLNNSCIQKLLGYSSMIHVSWMILGLSMNTCTFWLYFVGYLSIVGWLSYVFSLLGAYFINQFKFKINSNFLFVTVLCFCLNLSGFPPFTGFLVKLAVISGLLSVGFKFIFLFVLLISFLSCFFYLQLFYYVMLVYSINVKWFQGEFFSMGGASFVVLFSFLFLYIVV